MAARRKLPPAPELAKMVEAGMTHTQIADKISKDIGEHVSRSSVAVALSRANLTTRTAADKAVPWIIRPEHQNRYDMHMLRIHRRVQRGEAIRPSDADRYRSWRANLDQHDAVIHYEPRSIVGFWLVPRRPGIDTGVIREPDPDGRQASG